MQNPLSPIETLRQLKEMLDAGTITPAEFDTLKQQLVFTSPTPSAAASDPDDNRVDILPLQPEEVPITGPAESSPMPTLVTEPAALWQSGPAEETPPVTGLPLADEEMEGFEAPRPRNPLNLVLSIVGLLALLSLVLYLSFNNRSSEHLTSGSKTAEDSLSATIEEGPQAERREQTLAEPETVRLGPANPPPSVAVPRTAPAARDSAASTTATVADSVAH
ncbi:hypothetical protein GCM10023185_05150 [Hymenobacter saemangeumensis]|uniref:SHOCT domain-containing protein n=1 Tax=Hymenobacter saemangeumensis TaxID=1084522 RepID=A0ABP8I0N2_9BACT